MNKLLLHIILLLSLPWLLNSCIDDRSEFGVRPISEIIIETVSDTINVDFGIELVYEPKSVSQTIDGKELHYEWKYCGFIKNSIGSVMRDSLKFLSNKRVLKHSFKKLGKYELRLQVSNEYGSTFKNFTVFVQAAFDEGIFILSKNETGKGRVSFMRPLSKEEMATGKEESFFLDAFGSVNPAYALNSPSDATKVGTDIFITSQTDQLIYRIDGKTFDLYNVTDFKESMPWMKPVFIGAADKAVPDVCIMSENGKMAYLNYKSDIVYESEEYLPTRYSYNRVYSKILKKSGKPFLYSFFINDDESYIGYTYDYYFTYGYYDNTAGYFAGQQIINLMLDWSKQLRVISQSKENPKQIAITKFNPVTQTKAFSTPFAYKYETSNLTLTPRSQVVSNDYYGSVIYNNGNKLYRWIYTNQEPRLPTEPVVTLDEGCEITCLALSPDDKELYVGTYDPRATGLKGSLYIYDADKLTLLKPPYKGVADRPVKVFYKVK